MAGQLHGRRLTAKKVFVGDPPTHNPVRVARNFSSHMVRTKKKSSLNNPALHQNLLLCGAQVTLIYTVFALLRYNVVYGLAGISVARRIF